MSKRKSGSGSTRWETVASEARRQREERERGYREQALKLFPWVCGRCGRAFTRQNVHELTVHHKDHDHENNPPDGSNWELLCLYCHDNEHQRWLEAGHADPDSSAGASKDEATHNPFAALKDLMNSKS